METQANPLHLEVDSPRSTHVSSPRGTEVSTVSVGDRDSGSTNTKRPTSVRAPSAAYLASMKSKKDLAQQERRDSTDDIALKLKLAAMSEHGQYKRRYLFAAVVTLALSIFIFVVAGIIASTEKQGQANILFVVGAGVLLLFGYFLYQFLGYYYIW